MHSYPAAAVTVLKRAGGPVALAVLAALAPGSAIAQNNPTFDPTNPTFDQIVDRAIFQEQGLMKVLRGEEPLAETYIQDMRKDTDFGQSPKTDHYYLGKVDLTRGVQDASFLPNQKSKLMGLDVLTHLLSMRYLPRGFAQMMIIDGTDFDRNHYTFEPVRREFLGDVRTWVISVYPKKEAGHGRFIGQIWVEDRQFNIVRFNGTYGPQERGEFYMHFDSWRVNCGPDLWLPAEVYSEESAMPYAFGLRKLRFKAVTRMWGYHTADEAGRGEYTNMTVDMPMVDDRSSQAADNSPVESLRAWERQGEDNVLARLQRANLISPAGPVDKVLSQVVQNVILTNHLNIVPEVRTRVLLTTPLETFTVGHTIVISRGLLDTLPNEAALAAALTHELAHIALGQEIDTRFAFSDRVLFDDTDVLNKFRFARSQRDEDAANEEAVKLLENSPYKDKLSEAGLYLKALGAEADDLPSLIKPLFGSRIAKGNNILRMAALLQDAPQLQRTHVEQIAALPLGARTKIDPWNDHLAFTHTRTVPLLSAREKMPFELTPVYIHLTYEADGPEKGSEQLAEQNSQPGGPDDQGQSGGPVGTSSAEGNKEPQQQ